jgi:hypothetical protein
MENRIKVEDEVKNRGGFRDESSKLYVVINGSYVFLFPEEEFDKLNSIDRKIIWDTVDYVLQNSLTNKEGDTEYTFDMFDLMKISHTVVLPPITLKVDISSDDDVSGNEFNTLYNDTPYHVHSMVMKKAGEYTVYVNRAVYDGLSEDDKDTICDNVGSIAWSGCDKHVWFIESNTDFMNFSNIIFIDIEPNYARKFVLDEIEEYGGFKDDKTGEYVLYQYPCTFVLPDWFENVDKSCRENIYYICHKISQDENRPSSNSTNSYTYKWDDIMSCMPIYCTPRKAYSGDALGQLIERQAKDQLASFNTEISGNRIIFGTHHTPFKGELSVSVKRCIWDTLSPSVQSEITMALQRIIKAHSNDNPYMGWDLATLESVHYFIEAAKRDPVNLSQRTFVDMYMYTDALSREVYGVKVFDFMMDHVESFEFIIGKRSFFDKPLDDSVKESIGKEAMRIALLCPEERKVSFKLSEDCYVWKLEGDHFVPYHPESVPIIPDPDTEIKHICAGMIGGFNGTTFYVTDNDDIVKENMYEDEVRGERCKILKFTAKRNGIYFFSIEMTAWNALDAVMEDMLINKARIVSKIGCSAHIWHLNSVGAVEEFLNIPVKDEKNLLGLNKPNPIKEENTMFNKFPLKKKNNDNLPKKEANPTMPTPEQAKVILDAMYACQADTTQYAEDMRRDRARANAVMARAVLTHGILTDISMMFRNLPLPKDVKYHYATRIPDGELVVVTNGKSATEQYLDTTNSVPVTNLQDYANILGTLNAVKEQSDSMSLTAEETASVITNYIGCRDQALLNMLQDTNSLKHVIGENTVEEIESTEFDDLMITTSPTVMEYVSVVSDDDEGKK